MHPPIVYCGLPSIRRRLLLLLMLCAAAALSMGCRAKQPVLRENVKIPTGKIERLADTKTLRCVSAGTFGVDTKDEPAWSLLNSLLEDCGVQLVEPSWAITKWFGKDETFSHASDSVELNSQTQIKMEPLVQNMREIANRQRKPGSMASTFQGQRLNDNSVTLFNQEAKRDIEELGLPQIPSSSALTKLNFGKSATIAKLAFQPITPTDSASCPSGVCEIHAVTDARHPGARYDPPHNALSVVINTSLPCTLKDLARKSSPLVSINCFYYIVQHKNSGNSFDDRGTLSKRKYTFTPDDRLYILLGFHVMRDTVSNWTWATYWWTLHPTHRAACDAGREKYPLSCNYPWSFFEMDGFQFEPTKTPTGEVTLPPSRGVRYNPYIEGFTEFNQSNCVYCHARAMYRPKAVTPYVATDIDRGKKLGSAPLPCREIPGQKPPEDLRLCRDRTINTHFLWSLAGDLEHLRFPAQTSSN